MTKHGYLPIIILNVKETMVKRQAGTTIQIFVIMDKESGFYSKSQ